MQSKIGDPLSELSKRLRGYLDDRLINALLGEYNELRIGPRTSFMQALFERLDSVVKILKKDVGDLFWDPDVKNYQDHYAQPSDLTICRSFTDTTADFDVDSFVDADDLCPNQPEDGVPPYVNDGCPSAVTTSQPIKQLIAQRIPGDPSEASDPDLFIGVNELLMAVKLWSENRLPTNEITDPRVLMTEIALYWVTQIPVTQQLPEDPYEAVKRLLGQSLQQYKAPAGPVMVRRELSRQLIYGGESVEVSIYVDALEDLDVLAIVDIVPEGWSIEGTNFAILTNVKKGEHYKLTYRVMAPSTSNGIFEIKGLVRGYPDSYTMVSEPSDLQVILSSNNATYSSIVEAIAGSDGIISDEEFFKAVDYWVSGKPVPGTNGQTITDEIFFRIIDLWVKQANVKSSSRKSSERLRVKSVKFALSPKIIKGYIEVFGYGIVKMDVAIYDLNGVKIFSTSTEGTRMKLFMSTKDALLANGVYICVVNVRGNGGDAYRIVRKIAIMR